MDNFFTSGPLVEALAKDGIYTAGTILRTASGFPEALKKIKPPSGRYESESVGDVCYYTFNDRSLVSFVSNAFPESMASRVARLPPKGNVLKYQQVPPVLPAYNHFMGAVDRLSQFRKTYGFDRKSKRYWIRPFMTFLDYAINNAWILYKHNCKRCKVRPCELFKFRLDLVRLLLKNTRVRRRASQSIQDSNSAGSMDVCRLMRVTSIGLSRGRCYQCVKVKRPNPRCTSFGCSNCGVRLCKIGCFAEFHEK